MEGAATLAESLARSPQDIPAALARYESSHRAATRSRQRGVRIASHLLVPRSSLEMMLRDQSLRLVGRRWRSVDAS
jgi:2-polyprenyl-6-methoxyphenol hydroxylase-like FAD-dependent oxidoreductase